MGVEDKEVVMERRNVNYFPRFHFRFLFFMFVELRPLFLAGGSSLVAIGLLQIEFDLIGNQWLLS